MSCVKQERLNIRPHNDVVLKIRYITGFFIALKHVISPKKLELSGSTKICDIINSVSLTSSDAICYVFEHLTSPKIL